MPSPHTSSDRSWSIMKTTVLAILIACLAVIRSIDAARGLRIKFNISPLIGFNVFYKISLTEAEAKKDGWIKIDTPESTKVLKEFITYCYKDKAVCVFYEPYTLQIAGLQLALRKDRFTPCHFDIEKQGFNTWKTDVDGVETEFFVIQQFLMSSYLLKLSGDKLISTNNTSQLVQGDKFSIVGMDTDIMDVPIDVAELEETTLFLKKAYIPWMGTHYYYKMNESLGCSPEEIKPWFLLTNNGQVVGCSMMTFGKLNVKIFERDWWERPPVSVIKTIIPDGPQCLYDMAKECGVVTSHIYWIENPQSL